MYVILMWLPKYKRHQHVLRCASNNFVNVTLMMKLFTQDRAKQDPIVGVGRRNSMELLEKSATRIENGPYQGVYAAWSYAQYLFKKVGSKERQLKMERLAKLFEVKEAETFEIPSLDCLMSSSGAQIFTDTQPEQLLGEDDGHVRASETSDNLCASSESFWGQHTVRPQERDDTSTQLDSIEVQHDKAVIRPIASTPSPQLGTGNEVTRSQRSVLVSWKGGSKHQSTDNAEVARPRKRHKLMVQPESQHTSPARSAGPSEYSAGQYTPLPETILIDSTEPLALTNGECTHSSSLGHQLSEAESSEPPVKSVRTFLDRFTHTTETFEQGEARERELDGEISKRDARILAMEKELDDERRTRAEKFEERRGEKFRGTQTRRSLMVLLKRCGEILSVDAEDSAALSLTHPADLGDQVS